MMAGAAGADEVPPVGGDPAAFAIASAPELGRGPPDFGAVSRNAGLGRGK